MDRAASYRKLIVALVGAGVIIATQLGLAVPDVLDDDVIAIGDSVISLLTAYGVFRVPNAPLPPAL